YFCMEALMLSSICTVIFFWDSDGPVSLTSFRLNVLPDARPKNTMNKTTVNWAANAAAVMEPARSHSDKSNTGRAGGAGAAVPEPVGFAGSAVGSACFRDSAAVYSFS